MCVRVHLFLESYGTRRAKMPNWKYQFASSHAVTLGTVAYKSVALSAAAFVGSDSPLVAAAMRVLTRAGMFLLVGCCCLNGTARPVLSKKVGDGLRLIHWTYTLGISSTIVSFHRSLTHKRMPFSNHDLAAMTNIIQHQSWPFGSGIGLWKQADVAVVMAGISGSVDVAAFVIGDL